MAADMEVNYFLFHSVHFIKVYIFLPNQSLGMCWVSSRFTNNLPNTLSMFECLKSLIIGFGKGLCDQNFQCDSSVIISNRNSV